MSTRLLAATILLRITKVAQGALMPYNKTSPLANLPRLRDVMTKRASSWDRTGGNRDFIVVQPGASATLANIRGAGCINHVWCTMAGPEAYVFRKVLLRAWWDDEARPSIETPIGDFFGMGHAQCRNFVSAPFTMSPDYGRGFNCWLPMPFATRARFEIQSECAELPLNFYYYVDYERYDSLDDDLGRLHAQWRRQNPCDGIILPGGPNWSCKISLYRYHVEDPIHFRRSIRVTLEHGHANHRSDDYSSTAYWYQAEPHAPFPQMPDVATRLPR